MIVVDASVVVEMLINSPLGIQLQDAVESEELIVPHLLDVEVLSALRRLAWRQEIEAQRARELVDDLADLKAVRVGHGPLLERIWELRHNFSSYDASYIALAEQTGSVLYTLDRNLAAKGHRAKVAVFPPADN
jgi:predicted nucleic acid-binding protein